MLTLIAAIMAGAVVAQGADDVSGAVSASAPVTGPVAPAPVSGTPASEPTARDAYLDCLRMTTTDAAKADRLSRQWILQDGGAPARHCLALAQLAQGRTADAAETLAEAGRIAESVGDPLAADLYGQAGNAALIAGDPAGAEQHLDRALIGASDRRTYLRTRLLVDRALARTELGKIDAARADLLEATQVEPENLDAWLLLAAAERRAGNSSGAESAIGEAIRLAPANPEVLQEAARIAVSGE